MNVLINAIKAIPQLLNEGLEVVKKRLDSVACAVKYDEYVRHNRKHGKLFADYETWEKSIWPKIRDGWE